MNHPEAKQPDTQQPGTKQPSTKQPGMNVLVTGASGLLGSTVAARLLAEGHTVTTLQRRASGVPGAVDIRGSITDAHTVARAMAGQDAVIHLAAKVSMTGAAADFEHVNITGTSHVLEAAAREGVRGFVHLSSPSVAHTGGSLVGVGAEPAEPVRARSHYARTKAAGEAAALTVHTADFPVVVLRPHLMWGPGDTQLTERIITAARQGRLPIIGSGTALVDTLYSDNAVDAILAALYAVRTSPEVVGGNSYVLTNGQPRPIGELLARFALAGGVREPRLRVPKGLGMAVAHGIETVWQAPAVKQMPGLKQVPALQDEPPLTPFLVEQLSTAHWFDQRRTRADLGWVPQVSIAEGLERLAAYYGDNTEYYADR